MLEEENFNQAEKYGEILARFLDDENKFKTLVDVKKSVDFDEYRNYVLNLNELHAAIMSHTNAEATAHSAKPHEIMKEASKKNEESSQPRNKSLASNLVHDDNDDEDDDDDDDDYECDNISYFHRSTSYVTETKHIEKTSPPQVSKLTIIAKLLKESRQKSALVIKCDAECRVIKNKKNNKLVFNRDYYLFI